MPIYYLIKMYTIEKQAQYVVVEKVANYIWWTTKWEHVGFCFKSGGSGLQRTTPFLQEFVQA